MILHQCLPLNLDHLLLLATPPRPVHSLNMLPPAHVVTSVNPDAPSQRLSLLLVLKWENLDGACAIYMIDIPHISGLPANRIQCFDDSLCIKGSPILSSHIHRPNHLSFPFALNPIHPSKALCDLDPLAETPLQNLHRL